MDADRQLAAGAFIVCFSRPLNGLYEPDAITVLSSALSIMPTFWGAEFGRVVTALLQVKLTAPPALRSRIETLMSASAAVLPPAIVLPALIQLWDADPPVR